MGKYDSSRTRVAPVFNWLQCWDPTGELWVLPLLGLACGDNRFSQVSRLREARWWPREAKLPAPKALLEWLAQNCVEPELPAAWGASEATRTFRRGLVRRDPETIADALIRINKRATGKAAHVLEGATQPDALLSTRELLVVIEGKRKEATPTKSTWWMRTRHQMLRHLDGAWEQRNEREVAGLIIIDQSRATEAVWQDYPGELRSATVLEASLPHRTPQERQAIARSFLGIITWQTVCSAFGIPAEALPDEVLGAHV